MRYLSFIIVSILSLVVLISCDTTGVNRPDDLIEETVYVDLLVEFQLLKSLAIIQGSTNTDSLEQVIFDTYEVDEDRFLRSHYFYQSQIEAQIERVEKAINRVKKEQGLSNQPKPNDDFN